MTLPAPAWEIAFNISCRVARLPKMWPPGCHFDPILPLACSSPQQIPFAEGNKIWREGRGCKVSLLSVISEGVQHAKWSRIGFLILPIRVCVSIDYSDTAKYVSYTTNEDNLFLFVYKSGSMVILLIIRFFIT